MMPHAIQSQVNVADTFRYQHFSCNYALMNNGECASTFSLINDKLESATSLFILCDTLESATWSDVEKLFKLLLAVPKKKKRQ